MSLNFSEIPLTYGTMNMPWHIISEEGQSILDGFIMDRVNEFLWVFIMHQIMSYVLHFLAEILLILTYDRASTDQTMNNSHFHMTWVVGLEVQITTCFWYTFVANLGLLFMTKTSKNRSVSLA
jgi:heme A synthase